MKAIRSFAGLFAFAFVQFACAANLVDGRWLAKNLDSPDVLVLDAQPRPMHDKGHVPGAVPVDVFAIASFGVRDASAQVRERMYQALGIDPGRKIVIYDQGGTWFAPRVFFQLQYDGFPVENLAVLNGGMAKWQADGLPVSNRASPAPKPGAFRVTKPNEPSRTRQNELLAASGDRAGNVLIDALGPEYYYGAAAFFHRSGHIPNAVLMPADDFFAADKTFKSPEEIRRMAAHLGVGPERRIHAYCGGGGAAAVPYFALRHLAGYPQVKLSIESQMGWLQDERDLALWAYAAPAMMRDADWLASWTNRMMRMFGIANASVIDVRAAAAYAEGHLPFAVSVPGEAVRSRAADAGKLAEWLGAAGVDPAHEAVIVSGGGLTKDAALAYVLMEKLGQKRVSIFMEPLESLDLIDKLARKGFALTKEATIVGRPQKPTDLAVPPARYEAAVRESVMLAEAKASGGATPRIFLASGAAMPARAVEGKVIHLPYTQLLDAGGMPRAAKDIWAVLSKAGVPRYAELVAFADDPGEAAANFYLLKLMGFSDVKVLLAPG